MTEDEIKTFSTRSSAAVRAARDPGRAPDRHRDPGGGAGGARSARAGRTRRRTGRGSPGSPPTRPPRTPAGCARASSRAQAKGILDQQIFAAPRGSSSVRSGRSRALRDPGRERDTGGDHSKKLSETTDTIRQTLVSARQQEVAGTFQEDFLTEWTAKTILRRGLPHRPLPQQRGSAAGPVHREELAETQGCDAPVASTRPQAPGTRASSAPRPRRRACRRADHPRLQPPSLGRPSARRG